jgi:hypothetical protein
MANNDRNLANLGLWANADFIKTFRGSSNDAGADSDLPNDVRFLAGVAKLIRRRLAENNAGTDPACPNA